MIVLYTLVKNRIGINLNILIDTRTKNQVALVLSLDIAGAFDTVKHLRLLDNLRKKGILLWFVQLVHSFLTEQTTTLLVDNEETAPRQLNAGVPQGSPLSPILFSLSILYYLAEKNRSRGATGCDPAWTGGLAVTGVPHRHLLQECLVDTCYRAAQSAPYVSYPLFDVDADIRILDQEDSNTMKNKKLALTVGVAATSARIACQLPVQH